MPGHRRWPALLLLCIVLHAGLYGCVQHDRVEAAGESTTEPASISERDFMTQAAEAHLADLDMARVAKQHSRNSAVKSYAGMILKEHEEGLQDLTRLMSSKNMSPPGALDDETKQDIDRMESLSGAEFDREFINMMVSGHEKTLALFRSVSFSAHDTDVQDYVDAMIPKLDKHLRKAQELQSRLFSGRAAP